MTAVADGPERRSPLAWVVVILVRAYRLGVSPLLPAACRFHPTCSAYAIEAVTAHGAMRGGWMTARRILRCRPGCEGGYDPVPVPTSESRETPQD